MFEAIHNSISVFYNHSGQEKCADLNNARAGSKIDQKSLEYLECTELPTPIVYAGNDKSMFIKTPFNLN